MARVAELTMAPTAEEIYARIARLLGEHDRDQVVQEIHAAVSCPICAGPLTSFCPRCRGRAGASKITPKKLRHLRRISKKKRPGRKKKSDQADGSTAEP